MCILYIINLFSIINLFRDTNPDHCLLHVLKEMQHSTGHSCGIEFQIPIPLQHSTRILHDRSGMGERNSIYTAGNLFWLAAFHMHTLQYAFSVPPTHTGNTEPIPEAPIWAGNIFQLGTMYYVLCVSVFQQERNGIGRQWRIKLLPYTCIIMVCILLYVTCTVLILDNNNV